MPKIDVAAVPVREGLGVCAAARENDSDPSHGDFAVKGLFKCP